MILYLLDTSAIMAHFLLEAGGKEIGSLLEDAECLPAVCVVTWLELAARLAAKGIARQDRNNLLGSYRQIIPAVYGVDDSVVDHALALKEESRPRLPSMDALIAGCAAAHDAVLVHRDPHFDAIPQRLLKMWNVAAAPAYSVAGKPPGMIKERKKQYQPKKSPEPEAEQLHQERLAERRVVKQGRRAVRTRP